MGLVGLKDQCTRTILVFECLTLIPSGAFWDLQTRAPITELWIQLLDSSHSLTAWIQLLQGHRMQGIRELSVKSVSSLALLAQLSGLMSSCFVPGARSDGDMNCGLFCMHI